jgi:hypothetical protein
MSDFFNPFCLYSLIESWFEKSCDSTVVYYCEPTTSSCISWYQSLATFMPWREENVMEEADMQVLVLCMSAKKQHMMND